MTYSSKHLFIIGLIIGYFARLNSDQSNAIYLTTDKHQELTLANVFTAIQEHNIDSLTASERLLFALVYGFVSDETAQSNLLQPPVERATAYTSHLVQSDENPTIFMSKIWSRFSGIDDKFDNTLRRIGHVLGNGSVIHSMRHIAQEKTLNAIYVQALYCVMRSPESHENALRTALQAAFEPQLVSTLVSAYLMLRLGVTQINADWLVTIEQDALVETYIEMLSIQ